MSPRAPHFYIPRNTSAVDQDSLLAASARPLRQPLCHISVSGLPFSLYGRKEGGDPHSVRKTHRVVWSIRLRVLTNARRGVGRGGVGEGGGGTGKKKHIALIDPDVFELAMVDDF